MTNAKANAARNEVRSQSRPRPSRKSSRNRIKDIWNPILISQALIKCPPTPSLPSSSSRKQRRPSLARFPVGWTNCAPPVNSPVSPGSWPCSISLRPSPRNGWPSAEEASAMPSDAAALQQGRQLHRPLAQTKRRQIVGLVAAGEADRGRSSKALPFSATSSPTCTRLPPRNRRSRPSPRRRPPSPARSRLPSSAVKFPPRRKNFTRDLANEPANLMTPRRHGRSCASHVRRSGPRMRSAGSDRMRQLGMGSLLGVAQGSAEPPALIVVRYRPASSANSGQPTSGDHWG